MPAELPESPGLTDEIELKLSLARAGARSLVSAGVLPGEGTRIKQRSTYFDTADHALFAHGFSLRIRSVDGVRRQTLKSGERHSAGLFGRGEWERTIAGDCPVLDSTLPLPSGVGMSAQQLVPVFVIDAVRREWRLCLDGTQATFTIDRCTIVAGSRKTRFAELECEISRGEVAPLFVLARRLDRVAPVRVSVLGKAERGYRLLAARQIAEHAMPVPLEREVDAATAFRLIVTACLRHYRINEDLLLDRHDAEALHQARVALRRLRAAFQLFAALLDDSESQRLERAIRRLARRLGVARDLDVAVALAGQRRVPRRLRHRRRRAYHALRHRLRARQTRLLMVDIAEWLVTAPWLASATGRQPARLIAAAALDRQWRKVGRRARRFDALGAAGRHTLRKQVKQLRYASAFAAPLFDRPANSFIARLEVVQDRLGTLTDRTIFRTMFKRLEIDKRRARRTFPMLADHHPSHRPAQAAVRALLATKPFWPIARAPTPVE